MKSIDPDLLLRAYSIGVFPMADSRAADDVYWVEPKKRGILPLDQFRLSRSLAKTIRSDRFTMTADQAFGRVVSECAAVTSDRPDTWINPAIEAAYADLHRRGHAHSIECWRGDRLVGGLYGVRLGGAFFGESMFSRESNASKVALAWLVARLRIGGFRLLDCQFITDHLQSLGAIEVTRDDYVALLDAALGVVGGAGAGGTAVAGAAAGWSAPDFFALDRGATAPDTRTVSGPISGCTIVQLLGQTS
ncbi:MULTISPECIES: leucyl/phenylalanyl-tRNA--protein transferase [unclassified Sphingomonas]|uniref:leucyl/phenylalanyl-tRNA--protein transferase n=1 Tax=unclassified Sphingomonas TaxID=196159 RepID=UPI0006F6137C|nr:MULTISPECIES: leucyl/phenylalanyl-tRNA--protein transferase [unclassified Sphingomonas]KQX21690.1 leucyl/phenylalanyl-tRNA--protein transferase [Sphingomonas sp. Root1294]KQY73005.1 leucyl/phenylalanyl-tRNA--protein transferase [Sphingomonas sp. Root50]KRB88197.1 leucyl/phenylalanyl-tRNA--protein transferase [Sphingomonas sp. Root720]